ncbi:hypothetical protein [Aeromonas enteropelogenes]|uniref:hypothetical protein n=1 Tax=Aeromonas enteropelogenes TaxID=29489 RepID=UPI000F52D292|nr:hypothetical protein [Aeromonas enteropelogenes]RQM70522.1 hypothetical protein EHZ64_01055 [Aeromonas enteropelogenes]
MSSGSDFIDGCEAVSGCRLAMGRTGECHRPFVLIKEVRKISRRLDKGIIKAHQEALPVSRFYQGGAWWVSQISVFKRLYLYGKEGEKNLTHIFIP